ncbi:MAG: hypothetical protein ACXVAP_08890, partial [Candidatus Limnocylindrales bacterium]
SDALSHGGTFNGAPVAAAAGLATLRELTPPDYDRLERLGERLRSRVEDGLREAGSAARTEGVASLFQVWQGGSAVAAAAATPGEIFLGLLMDGFFLAPRGMGALATPATELDVDELAGAIVRRVAGRASVPA